MKNNMFEDIIRQRLVSGPTDEPPTEEISYPRYGWDNPKYERLESTVHQVMSSYQNANKWLDSIKEFVLMDMHCPYFSRAIHELAHMMPVQFDKFGDILHSENLSVPYPATDAWKGSLSDRESVISSIYEILDAIKRALLLFKETADSCGCEAMSIDCDELLLVISNQYRFYHLASAAIQHYPNPLQWDLYIRHIYDDRNSLE